MRWGLGTGLTSPAPLAMRFRYPMAILGVVCGALSPGLKAAAQLLELSLGWQGERNSLASEKTQVCGTRGE